MTTPWTAASIPSQLGRVAVVTGANSGIGFHTALELARAGATVILAARTPSKGNEAVASILKDVPTAKVRFERLDLASLASVRAFAERVSQERKLDLLVNNAGVMSVPTREQTSDGFELQFGTNFIGPFALTGLLMPVLTRAPNPRVTIVSSVAANLGRRRIEFEDLQSTRDYKPWAAYCQSKLADLLFAAELGRRFPSLTVNASHPGYARTNLQTTGPGRPQNFIKKAMALVMSHDAASGALPTLRAATSPEVKTGSYFGPASLFNLNGPPVPVAVPEPALNVDAAKQLWAVSEKLTNVIWPSG